MKMSENKEGSAVPTVIAAFAVGALMGAGLAILFAPRSGKETRDMIAKKGHDLKDAASEALDEGKKMLGEAKDRANHVIASGKEAVREVADSVTRRV